jgi:hypothetical protein
MMRQSNMAGRVWKSSNAHLMGTRNRERREQESRNEI